MGMSQNTYVGTPVFPWEYRSTTVGGLGQDYVMP